MNIYAHTGELVSDEDKGFRDLIVFTEIAAGWAIAMSIVLMIAMLIALILVIANLQYTAKLVLGILVSIRGYDYCTNYLPLFPGRKSYSVVSQYLSFCRQELRVPRILLSGESHQNSVKR